MDTICCLRDNPMLTVYDSYEFPISDDRVVFSLLSFAIVVTKIASST